MSGACPPLQWILHKLNFRGLCLLTVVHAFQAGELKSKPDKGTGKVESAAQSLAKAGSSRNQDEGGPNFSTYKGRDPTAQAPRGFEVSKELLSEFSTLNSRDITDEMFQALSDIVNKVLVKQIDIAEATKNIRSLRIQSKLKEQLLFMAEEEFQQYRSDFVSPEKKIIASLKDIKKQLSSHEGVDDETQCAVPHYNDQTGDTDLTLCLIVFFDSSDSLLASQVCR